MINDDEIEQRLQRLRQEDPNGRRMESLNLQKEIELRLAKLANRDPNFYSSTEPPVKIFSINTKTQTETEQTDSLMEQFMNELSIDQQRHDAGQTIDMDIEQRLRNLQKDNDELQITHNPKMMTKQKSKTGNLIRKLVTEYSAEDDDSDVEANEQFDWCSTCNEDGVLRCLDCDNDIYCRECFRELHLDSDMRGHTTQPYKSKSKY